MSSVNEGSAASTNEGSHSADKLVDVDVSYAYPVHAYAHPGQVAGIKAWLAEHGTYMADRFGEWDYINFDNCVHKGLALGRELRKGDTERMEGAGVGGRQE